MIDYNRPRIKEIFHFYFFKMDISVPIHIMDLKLSVCVLSV